MDELTIQGIQALKSGNKPQARTFLLAALEKNEDDLYAWLWLSGAVDNDQDRLDCLKQVLRIDPNHDAAAKGVAYLTVKGVVSTEPEQVVLPVNQVQDETQTPAPFIIEEAPEKADQQELGLESTLEKVGQIPNSENEVSTNEAAINQAEMTSPAEVPGLQSDLAEEFTSPQEEETPTAIVPETLNEKAPAVEEAQPNEWQAETEEPVAVDASAEKLEATQAAETETTFQIPDSFFATPEEEKESNPDWINRLDEDKVFESSPTLPISPLETEKSPFSTIPIEEENVTSPISTQAPEPVEAPKKVEEKVLQTIHPSLVTVMFVYGIGSIILLVLTLAFAIASVSPSISPALIGLVLSGCLLIACLIVFIVRTVQHLTTTYIITDRRVFLESGVIHQAHKSIQLGNIKDITLKQGLLQKLVGMGNVFVHTSNDETHKLIDVAKARRVISRIQQELSRVG
jgi:membrane protein YdbS with pleckstrin-like domain